VIEVIDIDDNNMVDESTLKESSTLYAACNGYVLDFPDGQNPHTAYPFNLHNLHSIPWDYSVRNGIMTLYSWSCCDRYLQHGDTMSCKACQGLANNGTLDGIRERIKDGVNKSAPLEYHGISGLLNLMRLQEIDKEFYQMRGLNQRPLHYLIISVC
jgi:hypothetical protein